MFPPLFHWSPKMLIAFVVYYSWYIFQIVLFEGKSFWFQYTEVSRSVNFHLFGLLAANPHGQTVVTHCDAFRTNGASNRRPV